MAAIDNLRKTRLEKLKKIRELGIDPYPAKGKFTNRISAFVALKRLGKQVVVVGRLMAIRAHGGSTFADLRDESGKIQIFFSQEILGQKEYDFLKLLDIGDFVEIEGTVFKTKAGEITVKVADFHLLTKAIRPLPEKREGLKDPELIFRKRYLDLVMNPERKEMFKRKAKFWELNRQFMKDKGFLEVEVPILEHATGGADARPFTTHMNALDQDFYLRISTELYQKRLIGGGFEKIYTLGPNFRNEGISDEHLPEYYQIEWYWAYADYRDNMELVKEMFRYIVKNLYGKTKFEKQGHIFDLADDWEEIDYVKIIKKKTGIDIFESSEKEILQAIKKCGVKLDGAIINRNRLIDNLWKTIRKRIAGPVFLVNEPKFISPLAKSKPDNPEITERFHVIIAGRELGNGYSELNDPIDQFERFKEQQEAREAGDEESQMMDIDFVEMLEYGMPPTSGYAHSERVFWTFEGVTAREATLFPAMRRKLPDDTKKTKVIKRREKKFDVIAETRVLREKLSAQNPNFDSAKALREARKGNYS